MASRLQTVLLVLVLVCVGLSYLGCRSLVSHAIDEMQQNYMSISTRVGELGMEFEYFKGRLMLQNAKGTMDLFYSTPVRDTELTSFWSGYEVLGVITVESNLTANSSTLTFGRAFINASLITLDTSRVWKKCVFWNGSMWTDSIQDCSTFTAAKTIVVHLESTHGVVGWSKPFSCFYGSTVCYLGLYETIRTNDTVIHVGVLLSFQAVAKIGEINIWETSGLATLRTNYKVSSMSDLNFSMFALTNARHNNRYSEDTNQSEWYLIESTSKNLITDSDSPYSQRMPYVTHGDQSEDSTVALVTQYLIQPSPDQIPQADQLKLLKQIFAYPAVAVYVYKDKLNITDTDEEWAKLDWIFVLSVSEQVFTGDFEQYAALAVICVAGALIVMYTFIF
ncbi:hypothetical protein RFI_23494 [Reticulomyxa filosa]|uniref:Uncharacterized protein n=1 Tax=Reticulomyxa filosa TaxID=46433 RepID=X6MIR7_RETFI|nr:hypothetical protein RFI_23494 [Reticulomyxa filosa]|eukprot:ETO13868.1 hypothetical protein RFI_23494 [Reticulomyxa filosa]